MDDGILSLKWNNHNATFIHTLATLHKLDLYSDVTLACDGKYFSVHKLVLSICSEYFEEILSRTKCQHPVVVLKDIKHKDLEALLNYMYAGEANVVQSELASLIKAAECLRIKGLAVPDETPYTRDKRHSESSDILHHSKKRKNEGSVSPENDSFRGVENTDNNNSRLMEVSKGKRRLEDLPIDSQPDRKSPGSTSNREDHKKIPEIVLEGEAVEVKQEITEPKIEEHDDSQHPLESSLNLSYSMNMGEEDTNENERHGSESQQAHILQDLLPHSVPGPSGVQGQADSISTWESNSSNLAGYSVEGYSSDDSRNQAMSRYQIGDGDDWEESSHAKGLYHHSCPYCYKTFPFKSTFGRHILTHTGEKPFKCPYCSHSTNRKFSLSLHIKTVHKHQINESRVSAI